MRLDGLFEDIDDRDEFITDCPSCQEQLSLQGFLPENFHNAHLAAEDAAFEATQIAKPEEFAGVYYNTFWRKMIELGFKKGRYGDWSIKEDLDDKDEFNRECAVCDQQVALQGRIPGPNFHQAHINALEDAKAVQHTGLPLAQAIRDVYDKTMESYGYSRHFTVKSGERWIKRFVKEDLDDKDEFKQDCDVCRVNSHYNPKLDVDHFHEAHMTCRRFIGQWSDDPKGYEAEMAKYGYYRDHVLGAWAKEV